MIGKGIVVSGLIGLSMLTTGHAQPSTDVQRRYKAAVRLVQTGDYERAKTDLNAIIQRGGAVAPYAHYYYALAAYRQKKFDQARLMLRQLTDRFPDWPKQPDATYLLGVSQLEEGRYDDGLKTLDGLNDPTLRADAARAEQTILGRATDLRALKQLNRTYPDNRIVGLALIELIQRSSSDRTDLELSDELTNRFGVPGTAAPRLTPTTSVSGATAQTQPTRTNRPATPATTRPNRVKSSYNVAVMMPFRIEEFNNGKRSRSNQYVYDLYNGMLLAKARLQEEGITVNLLAYDLDNDPNKTLELVNSPAFAQTDLIIGPLYVEPNRIVSAWANENGVILLNPIATSSELIQGQPMSFLAQSSLARQAEQLAGQAQSVNSLRRAAIYFGNTRKDSLLAATYRDELLQQRYQIADFRRMGSTAQATAASLFKPVPRPGDSMSGASTPGSASVSAPAPTPAPAPAIGHVFLSSSNDTDGPRLQEALSSRRVNAPLLATASAFNMYKNGTSTFSRRDLYLLYPDYVSSDREVVTTFNQTYLAERNTIPSVFASEGYDMLLFFGRQLAKNSGLRNRDAMRSDTDDYLLSGFDYTQANDNQIVPIVKFDGGRFIKIN